MYADKLLLTGIQLEKSTSINDVRQILEKSDWVNYDHVFQDILSNFRSWFYGH